MNMLKAFKKNIDLKLLGILVLVYTVISIVSFGKTMYLKSNGYIFQTMDWKTIAVKGYGYDWLLFVLFTTFIIFTTKKMTDLKRSWRLIIVTHLLLSLVFIVFLYVGSLSISIAIGDYQFSDLNSKDTITNFIRGLDLNFIIYLIVISIIYAYNYLKKEKQTQLQKLQLATQLVNAKMQVLKSQLQPHFLFNTLNTIHSLMDNDKKKSKLMLLDLSELLREIVDHREENLIELQDEIRLLKKYLGIIKIRFSEDLKVELKISKNLENTLVPSMLLQPIVENSVKYGYSKKNIDLTLTISVFKEEQNLVFFIQNNGEPLNQTSGDLIKKGSGIKNTIERLKTLYEDQYYFKFYNSEIGVTTQIKIPYQLVEASILDVNTLTISKNISQFSTNLP